MDIALTAENYYSNEANRRYMSVSQFKEFAGTTAHPACEMAAYKNYVNPPAEKEWTKSLLVGSYVDAFFDGTLDKFKEENRNYLCTKASIKKFEDGKGPLELFADFKQAESMIARLQEDPMFMKYCSGQTQVIMTANLFDIDWKIRMDFYFPDDKITDLKIIKNMEPIWSPTQGRKVDFIHYWGYDIQGAIYQAVVEKNTGKKLPFYINCATKEEIMNYDIIEVEQKYLDDAMEFVERNLFHVLEVRNGLVAPVACGTCASCRKSKMLKAPTKLSSIMPIQYNGYDDENDFAGTEPVEPMGTPGVLFG